MAVMLLSSFESFFNLDIWSSSVSFQKIEKVFQTPKQVPYELTVWIFQLYFFSLNQLSTVFGGICGLYAMFKSDGTIDKIFTGGAGKNGATVAVSDPSFSLFLHDFTKVAWFACFSFISFVRLSD